MRIPSFSDSLHFVIDSLSTAKSSIVPAGKYLGNVFHKTVVSLAHSVNTLTGRVSPAPFNPPCIKKSSELIDKLQSLNNHHQINEDEIRNWVVECGSFFDRSSIARLSENRLLQFTSLLATFKDLQELQIYREQLPDHAKSYLQILISNDSSESKAKDVTTLFSKNKNVLMAGLAHLVNHEKMPLKTLVTSGILQKNQLLTLAPFLHYVDLKGIYEANDPTFEISLLEKCPNLKVLLIENPKITILPVLPLCQKLNCRNCQKLQSLPELPLCRELNCSNCTALQILPALSLCQKLDCYDCTSLQALSALPLCQKLDCSHCTSLQALPALPLCQLLDCSRCPGLQVLPALPICQTLYCFNCTGLQVLPALPLSQKLYCSNCTSLQILPALPFCRELYCLDCTSLQLLPELPLCEELRCSNCPGLQALPALPNCLRLEHDGCLNLRGLPELPFNAQVSGNNPFTKLEVELKDFDQNPVLLLEKLSHYLLQNQPFPNVYYFVEGQLSEAIDVGGVRRDFIARLFERLFAKKNEDSLVLPISNEQEKGVWPVSDDSEEMKIAYRTIGRVFTLCYLGTSDFKVGEIFDPLFFKLLQTDSASEEFWIRNLLLVKGLPETMSQLTSPQAPSLVFDEATLMKANILLDAEEEVNFSTVAAREQLREKMLSEAKDDARLKAVFTMTGELKNTLGLNRWNTFCLEEAEAVRKKIQGELSVAGLKDKLKFEMKGGVQPAAFNRVKGFLLNWIDRQDRHTLSTFIRAVTSNPTVGSHDILIEVYDRDPDLLPVAHTCFFTLELSANCPTQEVFDNKLNLLLTEGLAGSGFQVA